MKSFFRSVFINFFTIFSISYLAKTISYSDSFIVLFWAAFCLSVVNLLIKPILNLLLMPINLLTLGASRWIINVLVLLLVTFLVTDFKILSFNFPGASFAGFVIPSVQLSFFWTVILVSFFIDIFSSFIYWLIK